jgi:hypothetical protein
MSNDFRTGENPFRSPTAVGVRSGTREDLFKVAKYQRGVLFCLLFQILIWAGSVVLSLGIGAPEPDAEAMPAIGQLLMSLALVVVSLTGVVFVFLLAINVYSTGVGVLLGILSFIPCIGLLVLLSVNGKATSVLRDNDIHVGFLGANLSQFE